MFKKKIFIHKNNQHIYKYSEVMNLRRPPDLQQTVNIICFLYKSLSNDVRNPDLYWKQKHLPIKFNIELFDIWTPHQF